MSSGISFTGLSSGIDSGQIIEQLIAIDRRPITLLENQQAVESQKLAVLQGINTSLLSVKTSIEALADSDSFDVFSASSSDSDAVGVATTTDATAGSFSVEVLSLAQSQVQSSGSFSTNSEGLGLTGDILVNGSAVSVSSNNSLGDIRDRINEAGGGVRAQILQVSEDDFRLLLTSEETGSEGFSLLDASSTDLLQSLGFTGSATSLKNGITGGTQTDAFQSSTSTVGGLLGISESISGDVTIGDQTLNLDLSTMSLIDIKAAIDTAAPSGVTTSIVTEEDDEGTNVFRLQIDGTTTFVDDGNVLEALGILQGTAEVSTATAEVHTANVQNTVDGSTPIDASAKFDEIFGANVQNGETITISGTTKDGTDVSGSFTISNASNDDIQDLLDEVESIFGGSVTASVDGSGQLVVAEDVAGASALSVTVQANNELGGTLLLGTFSTTTEGEDAISREVVAGMDSSFRVNGVTMTRTKNTVTDALDGVTLTLKQKTVGSPVAVSIAQDTAGIRGKIDSFVTSYNGALTQISDQFRFDEASQTSGALSGDATLLTLQAQLRSIVGTAPVGLPSNENNLALFGITFNRDGVLEIDDPKLTSSLDTNISALRKMFIAEGTTSDSDISFIIQGDNTKPGTYDIEITAAPEQATTTGSTDLSAGLAADQSITITEESTGVAATIDLTLGDDADTVASKINTALSTSVAETKLASIAGTQISDGLAITADTTLDDITGAGVAADDTIDIQGTLHNGERVSGSFKITDPTTQTVGDLLSEIRSIFQAQISTSVDSNGQLVLTDNQVGTSELTVVLIERNEGGGSLDFGGMETSDEGRFAIGVTASNEGGFLNLTADNFGSQVGFTVGQDVDGTGIVDDTYNGLDVAGTINGEAAGGTGRVLTGNAGSSNSDGLSLRVELTAAQLLAQGPGQGTIKITQGVAEQLSRALGSITDPIAGMVATREGSIEDTIESTQNQINAMELRLELKRSTLLRQFTAMEQAIAELNSTGSFLGSQLASLGGAASTS